MRPVASSTLLAVLSLPVLLLAGCSSAPAAEGDEADGPSGHDHRSTADPTPPATLLDVAVSFELNDPLPAQSFHVPANATGVLAKYDVKSEGACEAVVGEPDATAAEGAWMEFVAPSGAAVRVSPLGGQLCQAAQQRPSFAGEVGLPLEPGDWDVRFGGRGIGAWLQLTVEAQVLDAA